VAAVARSGWGAMPNKCDEKPGDEMSLERLFADQETPLLAYAASLTRDAGTAQDIVQEAFMKLHLHLDTVRQPKPWLYRTVHHLALNQRRTLGRIVPFNTDQNAAIEPTDTAPGPWEQVEKIEMLSQARRCLASLDPESRELIRLKFEEGLSYQEIGVRMGIRSGNVGYRLHHVLKDLAIELKEFGGNS
jgi:RNA polymerase sigma factor (sigma-70 family)